MKTHKIKLNIEFCDDVLSGRKNFEIRFNDRGYQAGDLVNFIPVDGSFTENHEVQYQTYEITYVLSGWGLKENWVVFGIKPYEDKAKFYADGDLYAEVDKMFPKKQNPIAFIDEKAIRDSLEELAENGFSLHNIALVLKKMLKEQRNE